MSHSRVLVIDDDALMREFVEEALVRKGYEVETAHGGPEGLDALKRTTFDVVVTDLKMTPIDGIAVVREVRRESADTACIVMTAYGTIQTAVAALKEGAQDYILKPFDPDELEIAVSRALDRERLLRENRYLRAELNHDYDFGLMVGESPAMRQVYDDIRKVSRSRATVLVRGETGAGKELVARAIHYNSPRREGPFIKVNCAALSAGLLESELFGHEKGAFTGAHERKIGRFELADTGTLLLDEISEINTDLQPKLLRALQEREIERVGGASPIQVDARIVCTSNRNLEEAVESGQFRSDLFFRLNVIPIVLPPLRDRREDIIPLMDHFLARYAQENGRNIDGYAPETKDLFLRYHWPGNVRELQNAIERAVVLSTERVLGPEHFSLGEQAPKGSARRDGVAVAIGTTVAEMERELILKTLEYCSQNRTRAAEMLGISVRTLRNKIKEYGDCVAGGDRGV
jgi:two-component system, NtrC family, response regulator AtoC